MAIAIVDIASEIFLDLSQPSTINIPEIAFWLRTHIGDVNNLILTSFTIDPTTQEITPNASFGEDEKSILKALYYLKYYDNLIRYNLGAAGIQTTLEYTSDGTTIRRIDRTKIAQFYSQVRKDLYTELKDHATYYKINRSLSRSIEGEEVLQLVTFIPQYNRILNQGF